MELLNVDISPVFLNEFHDVYILGTCRTLPLLSLCYYKYHLILLQQVQVINLTFT